MPDSTQRLLATYSKLHCKTYWSLALHVAISICLLTIVWKAHGFQDKLMKHERGLSSTRHWSKCLRRFGEALWSAECSQAQSRLAATSCLWLGRSLKHVAAEPPNSQMYDFEVGRFALKSYPGVLFEHSQASCCSTEPRRAMPLSGSSQGIPEALLH